MGLGILLVTHDISVARKVSDRIVVLLKGRIVEEGATDEILIGAGHPYTQTLIESASERLDPRRRLTGAGPGQIEDRDQDMNKEELWTTT